MVTSLILEYGFNVAQTIVFLLTGGWCIMKIRSLEKKQIKHEDLDEKKHFYVDQKYDRVIEKLTDTNLRLERVTTILELNNKKTGS